MFDFGENWRRYSIAALDHVRIDAAREALLGLVGHENVCGKRFLDIGCGSGIVSIAAAQCSAAEVVGIDISPEAVEVSRKNAARFGPLGNAPNFQVCSVLDTQRLTSLGIFDTVYAWGSLHHTGRMWQAIDNAAARVKPTGIFALAIYNRHITSPLWNAIKWGYNGSPRFVQRAMVAGATPVIAGAKFAVTGANPLKKDRGMDFHTDVVDWIGGYPYEYARAEQIEAHVKALGFIHLRTRPGKTPTACNEFVFQREAGPA